MKPAVLRGWIFPEVPSRARLYYAVGEVGLVAPALYTLAGASAHGGAAWVFDPRTVEGFGARDFRCRLLAIGLGILNPASSHAGLVNLAPGAAAPIFAGGGLFPGLVAAPTPYTHLHIASEANIGDIYYRDDGATNLGPVGMGDERAFKLRDGVIDPAADVFVVPAAGAPRDVLGHLNCHNRDEVQTFTATVGREKFTPAGVSLGRRDLPLDTVPLRAQALEGINPYPELYPIQPGTQGALLQSDERWVVRLLAPANLRLYTNNLCLARALLAVAVWLPADERDGA